MNVKFSNWLHLIAANSWGKYLALQLLNAPLCSGSLRCVFIAFSVREREKKSCLPKAESELKSGVVTGELSKERKLNIKLCGAGGGCSSVGLSLPEASLTLFTSYHFASCYYKISALIPFKKPLSQSINGETPALIGWCVNSLFCCAVVIYWIEGWIHSEVHNSLLIITTTNDLLLQLITRLMTSV